MAPSDKPVYTEDQLQRYLEYVGMPDRIAKESCNTSTGLEYLNRLISRQQAKVPFENLDLHYSETHHVSIDTEILFNKIVEREAGRGGYCMQNNSFFAAILRTLGYKVVQCGARVSSAGGPGGCVDPAKVTYTSWSHTVTMVIIDSKKYFLDVGYGTKVPSFAIPLQDGWSGRQIWQTDDFDNILLQHSYITESTFHDEAQKLWLYNSRSSTEDPWLPMYCFTETEFLPQDLFAANYTVSHSLSSIFTYSVISWKCLLDDSGKQIGEVSLSGGRIKIKKNGESEVVMEAKTEQERIEGLEKYFGITLNQIEKNGIKGYSTMLRG